MKKKEKGEKERGRGREEERGERSGGSETEGRTRGIEETGTGNVSKNRERRLGEEWRTIEKRMIEQ